MEASGPRGTQQGIAGSMRTTICGVKIRRYQSRLMVMGGWVRKLYSDSLVSYGPCHMGHMTRYAPSCTTGRVTVSTRAICLSGHKIPSRHEYTFHFSQFFFFFLRVGLTWGDGLLVLYVMRFPTKFRWRASQCNPKLSVLEFALHIRMCTYVSSRMCSREQPRTPRRGYNLPIRHSTHAHGKPLNI
jgi:hypothetical protein